MPSSTPRLSLCVPAYNGMPYLQECLDSIRAQTSRDFELIVVDDASTDGTSAFLAHYARREPRLRLHRNRRNLGLVGNWNRCVSLARGAWIKFVFQDDCLRPSCLARLLAARRPGVPLVACRRALRVEKGTPAEMPRIYRRHLASFDLARDFPGRGLISAEEFSRLLARDPAHNRIGEPSSVLIRRSAFFRWGRFNPAFVSLCDWEFFARLAANAGLCFVPEALSILRLHARTASAVNRRQRLFRAEVIDPLILRHELVYSPAYAPVRRAAGQLRPRVDLTAGLQSALRQGGRRIDGGAARRSWDQILRAYPRWKALLAQPTAPDCDLARRRDVARRLWRDRLR